MSRLVGGRISRRNIQTFDQRIHPLSLLFHFVNEKGQLRNDAGLVADPVAQRLSDFFLVQIQFVEYSLFVVRQHHADVHLGQAQVGADAHLNDGDKSLSQQTALITLKDVAELFLNQPAELLLTYGAAHGSKDKKRRTFGLCGRAS